MKNNISTFGCWIVLLFASILLGMFASILLGMGWKSGDAVLLILGVVLTLSVLPIPDKDKKGIK